MKKFIFCFFFIAVTTGAIAQKSVPAEYYAIEMPDQAPNVKQVISEKVKELFGTDTITLNDHDGYASKSYDNYVVIEHGTVTETGIFVEGMAKNVPKPFRVFFPSSGKPGMGLNKEVLIPNGDGYYIFAKGLPARLEKDTTVVLWL